MTLTKDDLIGVFKSYQDPELFIDVWTLGLVYNYNITGDDQDEVWVELTFTSPMCPFGPEMVREPTQKIKEKGAKEVKIEVTFDPPWKPSNELREMLGV